MMATWLISRFMPEDQGSSLVHVQHTFSITGMKQHDMKKMKRHEADTSLLIHDMYTQMFYYVSLCRQQDTQQIA